MNYWARVLRVFVVLTGICLLLVSVFYSGIYQLEMEMHTILSIIGIILILSLAVPVVSDGYKQKSIPLSSIHPDWKSIIQKQTEHTHKFITKSTDKFLLMRKEDPLLSWFYLGRRNIWIIVKEEKVIFYGPAETTESLFQMIFS